MKKFWRVTLNAGLTGLLLTNAACLPSYDPEETNLRPGNDNEGNDDEGNDSENNVAPDCEAPTGELCDGIDNDCDQIIDEDFPARGLPCGNNVGACLAVTVCEGGQETCVEIQGPEEEVCDGLDNDCNGATDEVTDSDPDNCGACGVVCAVENGTAGCVAGQCVVEACDEGFLDCDNAPDNGCETDATSDPTNCGACGNICSAEFAETTCAEGACTIVNCLGGRNDCNGFPLDGCEADLANDPLNCGACGTNCNFANALGVCAEGCQFDACLNGYGDLDGDPLTGCEVGMRLVDSPPDPNLGNLTLTDEVLYGAAGAVLQGYVLSPEGNIGELGFTRTLNSNIVQTLASDDALYVSLSVGDVQVFDISNPVEPSPAALITTSGPAPGLARQGDTLFIADGRDGLRVFDISSPSEPRQLTRLPVTNAINRVTVAGDRLMVNSPGRADLTLFDITDPQRPGDLGTFNLRAGFDQVVVSGDLLITGTTLGQPLRLYRLDPEQITFLGEQTLPGGLIGMDLRFPFLMTVVRGPESRVNVVLVDIRRPQAPTIANTFAAQVQNIGQATAFDGDEQLYVAGSGGLQRFDVIDPRQPASLQDLVRPQDLRDISFKDGRLFVSFAGTVEIQDYSNPNNPVLEARVGQDLRDIHAAGTSLFATSDSLGVAAYRLVDINDQTEPFVTIDGPRPTALESDAAGTALYMLRGNVLETVAPQGDTTARGSLSLPDNCDDMVRQQSLLFLACEGGLIVVDPAIPPAPPVIVNQVTGERLYALNLFGQTLYGLRDGAIAVFSIPQGTVNALGAVDAGATGLRTIAGAGSYMVVGSGRTAILFERIGETLASPRSLADRTFDGEILAADGSQTTFFMGTSQGVLRLAVETP